MNELIIKAIIAILIALCLSCATEVRYRNESCYDKCFDKGLKYEDCYCE